MKKAVKLLALSTLVLSFSANATNLLNNAGFETATSGFSLWATDEIWNGELNGSITGATNGVTPASGTGKRHQQAAAALSRRRPVAAVLSRAAVSC